LQTANGRRGGGDGDGDGRTSNDASSRETNGTENQRSSDDGDRSREHHPGGMPGVVLYVGDCRGASGPGCLGDSRHSYGFLGRIVDKVKRVLVKF
jgi:hypothetical protein